MVDGLERLLSSDDTTIPADVNAAAVAETSDKRTIDEVYADLTDWATARQERERSERAPDSMTESRSLVH